MSAPHWSSAERRPCSPRTVTSAPPAALGLLSLWMDPKGREVQEGPTEPPTSKANLKAPVVHPRPPALPGLAVLPLGHGNNGSGDGGSGYPGSVTCSMQELGGSRDIGPQMATYLCPPSLLCTHPPALTPRPAALPGPCDPRIPRVATDAKSSPLVAPGGAW